MKKAILDTDILSEVMRAKNSRVAWNASDYLKEHNRFTLSTMTVSEMVMGWHKIKDEKRTNAILAFFELQDIIPIGVEEAIVAGKILGDLERLGISIGLMDPFIAGTAIVAQLPLVTGNTRHFSRIVDLGYPLQLQNWREIIPNG